MNKSILSFAVLATFFLVGCQEENKKETVKKSNSKNAIESFAGSIEFQDQTITQQSAKALYRQIDLQRASQVVLWAMPITSIYQVHKAHLKNLKVGDDIPAIGLYSGYQGVYSFLTANVTTPYTVSIIDLKVLGPLVVELPEGEVYGVANNAWQEPIKEINSGKAQKLLFVGPGQDYPKNFNGEVILSRTYKILYFYRVLGTGPEAEVLKKSVKAYRLSDAENPPETQFIEFKSATDKGVVLNTQPVDQNFWLLVNEFVQNEPMEDRDRFFYAWLQNLGIEKGKPFEPTTYQKEIMEEALKVGMAMAQTIAFNKRFPKALYSEDSGWDDVMAGLDPKVDLDNYSMIDERTSYTFEAVTVSAGMTQHIEGKGSAYLGTYYDSNGDALMGGNDYKLKIEANPPAANFWSITAYDIRNRLILRNDTKKSDISSRNKDLQMNDDGSVYLYFGNKAPEGLESNWIQTNQGESFFLYLRLYGPLKPFINQSWEMNKIEKIEKIE